MISGLMDTSEDFLQSRQEHRHSFLVLQALNLDQLAKIMDEIKDFEEVLPPWNTKKN
jgi:hypothetical protein